MFRPQSLAALAALNEGNAADGEGSEASHHIDMRNKGNVSTLRDAKPAGARNGWRLPRTHCLCKLLAVLVAVIMAVHAASCGYFFCYHFPGSGDFSHRNVYDEIRDVYKLTGGPRVVSQPIQLPAVDNSPKLIPKLIHQTYKFKEVPESVIPFMESWQRQNEGWEFRFYDDEACIQFVQREFPEYLEAYHSLPKDVERSDFFRYLVVLRLGGLYADIDTECRRPMDDIIQPRDTMVVGWENEFSTLEEAGKRHYVRTRQVIIKLLSVLDT